MKIPTTTVPKLNFAQLLHAWTEQRVKLTELMQFGPFSHGGSPGRGSPAGGLKGPLQIFHFPVVSGAPVTTGASGITGGFGGFHPRLAEYS